MITISTEVTFKFVLRMDIIVAEDLSNSTQYSIVKDKAEYAVSSIYWLLIRVSFIWLSKLHQNLIVRHWRFGSFYSWLISTEKDLETASKVAA